MHGGEGALAISVWLCLDMHCVFSRCVCVVTVVVIVVVVVMPAVVVVKCV